MTVNLLGFNHVGIVVRDLDASVAWYSRHLGFDRQHGFSFPGAQVVFVVRGNLRLEFFQVDGAAPLAPERLDVHGHLKLGGINHFAIAVANLDKAVADLRADGVEVAAPPSEVPGGRGERFAFIRDNEGMLVELFQPG